MIDRRQLMTGMTAAGLAAATPALSQPWRGRPLAVQFFTFNSFCGKGWDKFSEGMETARRIGYDGIEFAGVWGHSPDMIRKRAEELGLSLHSYHLGNDIVRAFQPPEGGGIPEAQDAAYTPLGVVQIVRVTLGIARDLGVQWAGLGSSGRSNFKTLDSVKRLAEAFNTCGQLAREKGMKFFYHNHAIDFVPVEGRVPFDVLIEETGPDVRFEFDTGWAGTSGFDAVPVIEKHADRIDLIHLRDATAAGQTAAPGAGIVDFPKVLQAATKIGNPVYIMEGNGRPEAEAVAEATSAYRYLTNLGLGARTA